MLLSFYHTCASKQHHDLHDRESPMLSLSHTKCVFFIIELGLYIPMMGFLKMPQVFVSKRVGCTPSQFLLLSFHTLIALVHPLHGNPYLLTLISIDGHLHSPLIRLVDVRLSSPFLSSPQPPFYSTYSVISMAHAHVLREDCKSLRILMYETIAWLKPGLCMI